MFEVHYDNPGYHSGIIDSSGLEIMLTPKLRKYDSGLMTVGHDVTSLHLIPPGMAFFKWKYFDNHQIKKSRNTFYALSTNMKRFQRSRVAKFSWKQQFLDLVHQFDGKNCLINFAQLQCFKTSRANFCQTNLL